MAKVKENLRGLRTYNPPPGSKLEELKNVALKAVATAEKLPSGTRRNELIDIAKSTSQIMEEMGKNPELLQLAQTDEMAGALVEEFQKTLEVKPLESNTIDTSKSARGKKGKAVVANMKAAATTPSEVVNPAEVEFNFEDTPQGKKLAKVIRDEIKTTVGRTDKLAAAQLGKMKPGSILAIHQMLANGTLADGNLPGVSRDQLSAVSMTQQEIQGIIERAHKAQAAGKLDVAAVEKELAKQFGRLRSVAPPKSPLSHILSYGLFDRVVQNSATEADAAGAAFIVADDVEDALVKQSDAMRQAVAAKVKPPTEPTKPRFSGPLPKSGDGGTPPPTTPTTLASAGAASPPPASAVASVAKEAVEETEKAATKTLQGNLKWTSRLKAFAGGGKEGWKSIRNLLKNRGGMGNVLKAATTPAGIAAITMLPRLIPDSLTNSVSNEERVQAATPTFAERLLMWKQRAAMAEAQAGQFAEQSPANRQALLRALQSLDAQEAAASRGVPGRIED